MKRAISLILISFLITGPLYAKEQKEFKGKIAKSYEESVEWWPEDPRPPKGAPNIIIFLLDDTGFAQIGSFGGIIDRAFPLQSPWR